MGYKVPFFRKGWDGRALLVRPSKMHHSILKIIFVLGADDWKVKLGSAYSFMLKYSKITVWTFSDPRLIIRHILAHFLESQRLVL